MRFLKHSARMMAIACALMMSIFVSACTAGNGFEQAYSDNGLYGTPAGGYSRTIFSSHNF